MSRETTARWSEFCRRGSFALGALAVLYPVASVIWAWVVWRFAGTEVLVWMGDRASGDLPRLVATPKSQLGLDYYWYAIAAENAAMRWWTSGVAVLGGVLLLIAEAVPLERRRERREWLPWLLTALGLIGIGLDERFQLHELARIRIFEPAGVTDGIGIINPGDIATLIYPIGGALLWWALVRTLGEDRLSRGILIAVLPIGVVSVGIDVLAIAALDSYPGWVYGGLIEEFGEWAVVSLLSIVAWRRLANRLSRR